MKEIEDLELHGLAGELAKRTIIIRPANATPTAPSLQGALTATAMEVDEDIFSELRDSAPN